MDQLLWAPIFLSTIVAAQFTLEVSKHIVSLLHSQPVAVMWDQGLYGAIFEWHPNASWQHIIRDPHSLVASLARSIGYLRI